MADKPEVKLFPEEYKNQVDGLLWLGHLETSFEFCGHHFTLRTLKADEELAANVVVGEYADTKAQAKAWVWAHLALAIVAVDRDEAWCPSIGPNETTISRCRARFNYLITNWYWPTAAYVFNKYSELVAEQSAAVEAIQNL